MSAQPRSFLIINPFGIGDLLFSTPLIRNLHENFPGSEIHYFCKKNTAPLAGSFSFVDSVIEYDRDALVALQKKSWVSWGREYYGLIDRMRRIKADACFDLSLNTQYGFMELVAGVPLRIGFDYRRRALFLNKKQPIHGYTGRHVADYYLDLLRFVGVTPVRYPLSVRVDEDSSRWAKGALQDGTPRPLVALVPGGGSSWGKDAYLKQWPAERFSALAGRLSASCNARCVVFGDPVDAATTAAFAVRDNDPDVIDLRGKCTLLQMIAALDQCSLVIANDSGPFHIARALGKKTVAFFGPVDEKLYGPYPDSGNCVVLKRDLACRPCYNRFRLDTHCADRLCLQQISVDEVFAAARAMLEK